MSVKSPSIGTGVPAPTVKARLSRAALLFVLLAVLAVLSVMSIMLGAREISVSDIFAALWDPNDPQNQAIIWSVRIPRTFLAVFVGAGLGLAGALMQALTRNPLADPGLLGVSAGASFAIVVSVAALGMSSLNEFIWMGFLGAMLASVIVYALGGIGRGGTTPVKLALAGVAVSALLGALTSGIVLGNTDALNRYRYWAAGSLAGQDISVLKQIVPFMLVGLALALASAPALNSLALGDSIAKTLGRRVGLIRLQGAVAVTLLTGAAVAVCGPIVFIGLVVPHVARIITGPDHRWLLPYATVLAPVLLLAADILGRIIARPGEVNVGIIVAFIGGPFFIALVRRRRLAEL